MKNPRCAICFIYTDLSTKYPIFGREKMYYLRDGIESLIPFKVYFLYLHTRSSQILPLQKTLVEGLFCNGVHIHRQVLHYLSSTLKTEAFQCSLQFRKQPEVARSHICRPEVSFFAPNCIMESAEYLLIVRWLYHMWRIRSAVLRLVLRNYVRTKFTIHVWNDVLVLSGRLHTFWSHVQATRHSLFSKMAPFSCRIFCLSSSSECGLFT